MGLQNRKNLNTLLQILPEGVAAPSAWLTAKGYSRQLVRKYVLNGWLTSLTRGVYARPGYPVAWEGVLLGLHRLLGISCHVGGLSALNWQGKAQYLPLGGEKRIQVFIGRKPPAWVRSMALSEELVLYTRRLFSNDAGELGLAQWATGVRDWTLPISGPERAMMEMLYQLGGEEYSFDHAVQIFEGLTVLRPSVVSALLAACKSIKVKRLFLFLSAHFDFPWAKQLDTASLDLGRGNRQIVKSGRLDKEFLITIPEAFGAEYT